jgi:transposase
MSATPRKAYATDLTDEQWAILDPLIPAAKTGGRKREVNLREVINTILYLNSTGCQWDMLPHDLLPKSTVYDYFAAWVGYYSSFAAATAAHANITYPIAHQISYTVGVGATEAERGATTTSSTYSWSGLKPMESR